jgi:response regulator RpfG family c-di-GMP phosphodiesterase/GGDEF domain-containing protein
VDDEPALLAGLARTLRSEHFQIATSDSPAAALELLRTHGPFAVIVSDLHMPEMDGVTLLQRALSCSPDTVRVLFTGQPDMENAIEAVNKGAIFRFMVKPSSRVVLAMTLKAAVAQNRLLTAERVLLEQTLHGSIKALTDVLSLAAPMAFGRAARLRQTVRSLAAACGVSELWHIEVAAMLSQIGCVTLPPATLERVYNGKSLDEAEQRMAARLPEFVEQVLANIPRLDKVREILQFQRRPSAAGSSPAGTAGDGSAPWGARALKLAHDLDVLESEGMPTSPALEALAAREGWYDLEILRRLTEMRTGEQRAQVRRLPLAGLRPGMVLAEDVRTTNGTVFIARGQEVTTSLLEKLGNFGASLAEIEDTCLIQAELAEAHAPAAALPVPGADPVTGFPGREQAESVIQERCQTEEPLYALVFVVDSISSVSGSFSGRAGDQLLRAFGEFVEKILPQGLRSKDMRIFRWSGPTLIALLPRTTDLERVSLELRRLLEHNKFEYTIQTSTRSVLLPVSPRYAVLPSTTEPAELIGKIDSFVGALIGTPAA